MKNFNVTSMLVMLDVHVYYKYAGAEYYSQ